jgi:membrane protein YqaA with SNARE-associated domain
VKRQVYQQALFRRTGLLIAFVWSAAEATLFFVVPDVLLTLVALFSLRQSAKTLAAILAGALLGGSVLYFAGERVPKAAESMVLRVPFVSQGMFAKTRHDLEQSGIWTMVKRPRVGIPYKVYAVQAGRYSTWTRFLLVSTVARLERFAPFWIVAALTGLMFRRTVASHPAPAAAIHAALWIAGYAWYWTTI